MFAYLILFILIRTSYGLQCYACQSCSEPFIIDHAPMFYLPDNQGFNCTKEQTTDGINRGARKFCAGNNTQEWCCQTDLCNETTRLSSMNGPYLLLVFLMVVFDIRSEKLKHFFRQQCIRDMIAHRYTIFICLILFMFNRSVNSLKCYVCNSCKDPLDPVVDANTTTIDEFGYYCVKVWTRNYVRRDISKFCPEFNIGGSGIWCCQTDLCNEGPKMTLTVDLWMIVLLMKLFC